MSSMMTIALAESSRRTGRMLNRSTPAPPSDGSALSSDAPPGSPLALHIDDRAAAHPAAGDVAHHGQHVLHLQPLPDVASDQAVPLALRNAAAAPLAYFTQMPLVHEQQPLAHGVAGRVQVAVALSPAGQRSSGLVGGSLLALPLPLGDDLVPRPRLGAELGPDHQRRAGGRAFLHRQQRLADRSHRAQPGSHVSVDDQQGQQGHCPDHPDAASGLPRMC